MALAFDSSGNNRVASANALSYSHTVSGANTVLLVQVITGAATDTLTDCQYNGVSMLGNTLYRAKPTGSLWTYVFALYNPTAGTNTVSITVTGAAVFIASTSMSYRGAAQSGNFLNTTNGGTSSGTSAATTVSMTSGNSFMVGFGEVASGANPTAGTGTVRRVINTTDGNSGFDSNGPTGAAGNYTLNMGWTGAAAGYLQGFELLGTTGGTFILKML